MAVDVTLKFKSIKLYEDTDSKDAADVRLTVWCEHYPLYSSGIANSFIPDDGHWRSLYITPYLNSPWRYYYSGYGTVRIDNSFRIIHFFVDDMDWIFGRILVFGQLKVLQQVSAGGLIKYYDKLIDYEEILF